VEEARQHPTLVDPPASAEYPSGQAESPHDLGPALRFKGRNPQSLRKIAIYLFWAVAAIISYFVVFYESRIIRAIINWRYLPQGEFAGIVAELVWKIVTIAFVLFFIYQLYRVIIDYFFERPWSSSIAFGDEVAALPSVVHVDTPRPSQATADGVDFAPASSKLRDLLLDSEIRVFMAFRERMVETHNVSPGSAYEILRWESSSLVLLCSFSPIRSLPEILLLESS
jgi:hypothetical protein